MKKIRLRRCPKCKHDLGVRVILKKKKKYFDYECSYCGWTKQDKIDA